MNNLILDKYLLNVIKKINILKHILNINIGTNKYVFKSKVFKSNGINTQFQLDNIVLNATFIQGSWNVLNIDTLYSYDIRDINENYIYNINKNKRIKSKIDIIDIDSTGLVTLNYPPIINKQFNIYYWYNKSISIDEISNYITNTTIIELQNNLINFNIEVKDLELLFGRNYQVQKSLTETITTSSTYIEKAKLTTPNIPAGNYKISVTGHISTNRVASSVYYRIQVDDITTLVDIESKLSNIAEYEAINMINYIYLTTGTHTIDVDYKTITVMGSGVRLKDVIIEIFRVN